MRPQSSIVVRGSMLLLALLSSATALAQKPSSQAQPPRNNAAVPFIDIVSPTAARVHGAGFVLILDGAGFGPGAEVGFQLGSTTHPLPTVVVNEGEVAAWVPAKLLHEAATASITVTNRHRHEPGVAYDPGLASNPVLLPITKPTASVAFDQTNIPMADGNGAIVTADFNGDGQPDLAITVPCGAEPVCFLNTSGNIVILLGKHDGTFAAAPSIAVANIPSALATGDFNGDGKIDIAVTNFGAPTVTILFGDGLGGFTPAPSTVFVDSLPNSVVVGDFNRDGKLDLAVGHGGAMDCGGCVDDAVSILLGSGDGTFTAAAPIANTGESSNLSVADLNRDGILDLVFETGASPYLFAYAGKGDGTFSPLASPPFPAFTGVLPNYTLADVNRDGSLDLVFTVPSVSDSGQSAIATAFGKGNGLFHDSHTSAVVNDYLIRGALADFNGDGKLDVAEGVGLFSSQFDFFLGNGHRTFTLNNSIDLSGDSGSGAFVIADFNGDGKLDLASVTGNNHGGNVTILLQQ